MKPDLSIKEVDISPIGNWCDFGHSAPDMFRRNGAGSELEPIRFFRIVNGDIDKVFCEPCLIVANHLAKLKKDKDKKNE